MQRRIPSSSLAFHFLCHSACPVLFMGYDENLYGFMELCCWGSPDSAVFCLIGGAVCAVSGFNGVGVN